MYAHARNHFLLPVQVEAWGWGAATARLRGQQYRRAITAYRGKHL